SLKDLITEACWNMSSSAISLQINLSRWVNKVCINFHESTLITIHLLVFGTRNQEKVSDYVDELGCGTAPLNYILLSLDLPQIGDAVMITCAKGRVQFSASGELGTGIIKLSQTNSVGSEDEAVREAWRTDCISGNYFYFIFTSDMYMFVRDSATTANEVTETLKQSVLEWVDSSKNWSGASLKLRAL
uniref:Proliferating cell nuclear antigen PCNA C-terminal domain-containing protein n=1 Tax=Oncorhynchus mykiss TaxID=8022 RepID=A0A8C7V900_ONCMY